jgi:1-acyl-sn-glycerol-3-phosphate acyltransferase
MFNYDSNRSQTLFNIVGVIARVAFYPFFKIRVAGLENIPEEGPFILLPKHQRWEDIPIIGLSIKRPLYYVAKHELFKNYLSRLFFSSLGGLPLDRRYPSRSRGSLETMMILLRRGEGVVIFPEGTYYRGSMGSGHSGLIKMIFARFSIPFIPVGIRYTKKTWRQYVEILIGMPVCSNPGRDVGETYKYIMKEIARLSGFGWDTAMESSSSVHCRGAIHRARDFLNHSLPLLGGGGRGSRNILNETPPRSSPKRGGWKENTRLP